MLDLVAEAREEARGIDVESGDMIDPLTAVNYGDGTTYFQSRGYPAEVQFNGLPANNGLQYLTQFDLAMYDRVEVLRGPPGLLQGFGSPGGTVNLVRKRPQDVFGLTGSVSAPAAAAAAAAAGLPSFTGRDGLDVLQIKPDKSGVQWCKAGQSVGDILVTARSPGSTYGLAGRVIYVQSAFPDL